MARDMGLGSVDDYNLDDAQDLAREARKLLNEGIDPLDNRRREKARKDAAIAPPTFDKCAEDYIEAHAPSWKNAKHREQWTATIKTYAAPVFGSLPVNEVTTTHVVEALEEKPNLVYKD